MYFVFSCNDLFLKRIDLRLVLLLDEKLLESVFINFKCIEQCLTLQIIGVSADVANKAQGGNALRRSRGAHT